VQDRRHVTGIALDAAVRMGCAALQFSAERATAGYAARSNSLECASLQTHCDRAGKNPMSEHTGAILADFGPLSAGMAGHILLMNLLAPLVVLWTARAAPSLVRPFRGLAVPAIVQLLLLWGWHAPPALVAAMGHTSLHLAMHGSLLLAALWFWSAVVNATRGGQWRALAALLGTSKLFCLLGVLLTFASHPLYPAMMHHGGMAPDPLADQQLAGLLMLVACPSSYLVAAVIVASKWLLFSEQAVGTAEGTRFA
jgi:putative membrane protein